MSPLESRPSRASSPTKCVLYNELKTNGIAFPLQEIRILDVNLSDPILMTETEMVIRWTIFENEYHFGIVYPTQYTLISSDGSSVTKEVPFECRGKRAGF